MLYNSFRAPAAIDRQFFSRLFIISVPIMLQNFINSFVNMLDTFMIGRLGEAEISAAGLGNQIFFLLNLLLFAIGSSASVFSGQFWGRKDIAGLKKTAGLCFIAAFVAGLLFTVCCLVYPAQIIGLYTTDTAVITLGAVYLRITALCFIPFSCSFVLISMLRSIEQVKIAVIVTVIALSCNAVFNLLLIFGYGGFPRLGIQGAAIATVLSRFIELAVLAYIINKNNYPIIGKVSAMFGFDAAFVRNYSRIAAPVIVNEILWSFGITMHNKIFAGTGTAAYAAFTIMTAAAQLCNVVFIGMGNGAGVLIAKTIGEGMYKNAARYAKQLAYAAPVIAVGVAVSCVLPLSLLLPAVFKVSAEVISIMHTLFFVLICFYPCRAFNMNMVVGVFRAGGDTRFCLFYDVFFMWAVAIPIGFFAARLGLLPAVLYVCLMSEELLKMPCGIFRLKTGKWLHSVT
ncbi:MAG: MATE family efflux transporter [Treponema sp.]